MSEHNATFSVVLRAGIPEREKEFFNIFAGKITSDTNGEPLLHFFCTEIDLSHHVYIEMQTFKPGRDGLYCVRIPHHYVLLIDGSKSVPSIGFHSTNSTP